MADKPFIVVPTPLGTVASGNAAAATPADHLGEFLYKGMVWRSAGNANLWVRCDLGSARSIDFVGVLAANAQPGTTIRVRLADSLAEVDGAADYDSGVLPFISPAISQANGLYHSHLELPAPVTKQWLRIDIGGHVGDFEASMLVAGLKQQPAHYYETEWQIEQRDLGGVSFSRNGVPSIPSADMLRVLSYTFGWITEDEAESLFAPLDEAMGRRTPYLTCFDPAPTVYRQRRTFFGWNEEAPARRKVGFNRFEREFQILSLF